MITSPVALPRAQSAINLKSTRHHFNVKLTSSPIEEVSPVQFGISRRKFFKETSLITLVLGIFGFGIWGCTNSQKEIILLKTNQTGLARPEANNKPRIIFEGDSLMTGVTSQFKNSPKFKSNTDYVIHDEASKSKHLANQIQTTAGAVLKKYSAKNQDNVVVFWAGCNDVYANASDDNMFENLIKAVDTYRNKGFKVIVLTVLPSTKFEGAKETHRKDFNTLIRTAKIVREGEQGPKWDMVIDIARLPELSHVNNNYYAKADGIHLNAAGYKLIAGQIDKGIRQLLDLPDAVNSSTSVGQ